MKLVALIIGIGLMLWPNIGRTQSIEQTIDEQPVYTNPSPAQEKPAKQELEWEKEDRQKQKKMQEEKEPKTEDERREQAQEESSNAKIKKLERKTGRKVRSWQILNR